MAVSTAEERLTILETEVANIKAQLKSERYGVIGRTNPQALEEMFGMFANSAHAENVLRSIEEARERERKAARQVSDRD